MSKLVEQVKAVAQENYDGDRGWRVLVETYTDEQIAAEIKGARSLTAALRMIEPLIDGLGDVPVLADTPAPRKRAAASKPAAAASKSAATSKSSARKPAQTPAETTKPAPASRPAPKRAKAAQPVAEAPKLTKSDGRALATLSSEQSDVPADADVLRKLIKITRDRRWRAGRRGDVELETQMEAQLVIFTAKLAEMKPAAAVEPASNVVELRAPRSTKTKASK